MKGINFNMKKVNMTLVAVMIISSNLYTTPTYAFDWGQFGSKILHSVGIKSDSSNRVKVIKRDKNKPSETKATILSNNRMYQIVDLRSGYKKAKLYAERVGGHLAIIDSKEKSKMLYDFMVSQGYESAYFGLIDENLDGNWLLCNGEKPHFTNWQPGQPSKEEKNEKYAMLCKKYKNAKWKAGSFSPLLENSSTTAFIIEWDKEVKPQEYKEKTNQKEEYRYNDNNDSSWNDSSYVEPNYEEEISG